MKEPLEVLILRCKEYDLAAPQEIRDHVTQIIGWEAFKFRYEYQGCKNKKKRKRRRRS
jgi:hypothetical protein